MSQIWLIIAAAGFFMMLVLLNIRLALALFVALLPVYLIRFAVPMAGLELPSTLLEVMFGILFLGWLVKRDARRRTQDAGHQTQNLKVWAGGLTLLMVGAVFGVLLSAEPISALGLWRAYFLEPFLFFVVFVDLVRDAQTRRRIVAALDLTLVTVGVVCVIQKMTGWWIPNPVWVPEDARRVTAFYGFPNGIGLMAAPITVLMVGWTVSAVRQAKRWRDYILPTATAIAAALGLLAILFAVSEGAIIGLAAGLLALGLMVRPLRPIALTAIIAGCVLVLAYTPLRNYASTMLSMRDDSWYVRKIVWTESLDMIADRPVWGAGLSGYQAALVPYHQAKHIEIFKYPHNFFLNFWTETGLTGLIGFLLLVVAFFRVAGSLALKHHDEWLPAALIAAMIALLVHGLVDVPYFKNDLAMMFFVLLGLAESMRRQSASVDQLPKA